jgi:hypothetical protein
LLKSVRIEASITVPEGRTGDGYITATDEVLGVDFARKKSLLRSLTAGPDPPGMWQAAYAYPYEFVRSVSVARTRQRVLLLFALKVTVVIVELPGGLLTLALQGDGAADVFLEKLRERGLDPAER